ncbi:MAG: DUF1499 domain-containing protein [Planctomycetota bacterium]|nr:DUF1499 domain-containing protein [Planctomycetota bacterium]MDA1162217.1 DUF1499 domain-containing protein [Planctomycetota bacterium]
MSGQGEARLVDGKLHPCPDSPNCVCSEFPEASHAIAPLSVFGDPIAAWARLIDIVTAQARTTIVSREENYLQVRVRTSVLRFEDVVEFRMDSTAGLIHVRSASEIGHWDLGVNRRRIETIRKRYSNQR